MRLFKLQLLLFFLLYVLYSCKSKTLFTSVTSDHSGIYFNNQIIETDSINVLDQENVYNGGGVGIGDFNNDGLQDIYFTGNMVSNKLYLNKGDFKFRDVTDEAKVGGGGKWCRGAAVVDINNDGLNDIYVCATLKKTTEQRKNLLYVNQGIDTKGIPHFAEMAGQYGLADTSQGTQAAFFDYDNDGDLDVYIVNNEIVKFDFPNRFRPVMRDGAHPNTDKLYRNDWNDSLKHPVFTNVSKQAGITIDGYGHAVTICDINVDGWKDVYVSNDYLSNDLLWINNHDGTFTDSLKTYFKHTSANAMGNDVIDINNDGLADVVALDMNPEDNYRKKMMLNANSYQTYQNSDYFGLQYQYVRNTLQINQGPRVTQNDSIGPPIFSDVSFYAGIAETDWSWTPLVADFNNDGNRDIIVTNGFPKDVTDHDFVSFRNQAYAVAAKQQLLEQIPEVKIPNYAFKNNSDLHFENATKQWGLGISSFSNGAVYTDLDNDGDLDIVINNINDEAFVYKNNLIANGKENQSNHFLAVQFRGDTLNKNGLGSWIELYYDKGKKQVWENTPYRGYLSSVQAGAHFGLGSVNKIDSVVIRWPGFSMEIIRDLKVDQALKVDIKNAKLHYTFNDDGFATSTLFKEITSDAGINYYHEEKDYTDFNVQKLLPHKLSEYGPGLAAGDVDGDGLDDIISGGSFGFAAQIFLQQKNGKFLQRQLLSEQDLADKRWEDMGLLLFDADSDGDLDLYTSSGGYENEHNSDVYQDHFYINDGKGNFKSDSAALPKNLASKFCVRAADYDRDGDLDLFIAGRVDPWNYPKPVSSFIYRNDSQNGQIKFTDVTASVAKDLTNIGLTCDAVFTDFDNDGWQDLIIAGEWMPITFLKNEKGIFKNISQSSGINDKVGWWNTISCGDFDHDGDIDYVAGNLGLNSFYRASDSFPVSITAKDFDNNGSYDAFPSLYLPASQQNVQKFEFAAQTRDDAVKQMIGMRSSFQNYKSYATVTFDKFFTPAQMKGALILKANYFPSSFIKNNGKGKFSITPLPMEAQVSAINGMVTGDFNNDGNLDVLVNGNDYGTEVSVGRYDALNGLLLAGNGRGGFKALSILESGIFIPGNGKALVKLKLDNKYGIAASQNRGALKIFELKQKVTIIPLEKNDISATCTFKNGKIERKEFYYGNSFLSQSARFIEAGLDMKSLTITNNKGESRTIEIKQ